MEHHSEWEWEIKPYQRWFNLNLKELFQYKDLLLRFVRRDIIASYQQTFLGPAWVFLQPLLTTLVYIIVFRKIARLSTGGIEPILFYLPGIILWTFFSECLLGTMYCFLHNAYLFSKVYFPRLIAPLSSILFHSFRLSIQLLLFLAIYIFFMLRDHHLHLSFAIFLLPLLLFMTAAFAFGLGLILSVVIVKYRDIDNIMQFLIRLFFFVTPVVYPASVFPEKIRFIIWLNPLTAIIETCRAGFFSNSSVPLEWLGWSGLIISVLVIFGLVLFKKQEAAIMDIV